MAKFEVLRYDRSVDDTFLDHFLPGRFASSILEYARAQYPIDFQFRKDPKTGAQWASLYVGMTKVLDLEDKRPKGIRLTAHPKWADKKHHWQAVWGTSADPSKWVDRWPDVENYLERIIPAVIADGRFTKTEGLVQAAVSGYRGDSSRVMLDREVLPHFVNVKTRNEILSTHSGALESALQATKPAPGSPRTPFGAKCDVLALDSEGHLVAIEVKPGSSATLAWVPAQATMYARVLQHWVDTDPDWSTIITRMYEQRSALSLMSAEFKLPPLKPRVVPAVAYQRIANPAYIDRMFKVQNALAEAGVGDDGMKFYQVSLSGRLDEISPA